MAGACTCTSMKFGNLPFSVVKFCLRISCESGGLSFCITRKMQEHWEGLQLRLVPMLKMSQPKYRSTRDTRRLTFKGSLEMKNVYFPNSLQIVPKCSKSNSSPIGIPRPASNHSYRFHCSAVQGHFSKDLVSPATAANLVFPRNSRSSFEVSKPMFSGFSL